jgi:hypothetical protein
VSVMLDEPCVSKELPDMGDGSIQPQAGRQRFSLLLGWLRKTPQRVTKVLQYT